MGETERRAALLDDSDGGSDHDSTVNFKINKEYAKRFEHNKKREELQRLEEKFGKDEESEDSEDDETEDDEGVLVDEDVDAQITDILQAIRNKDPRIYDKSASFFKEGDGGGDAKPVEPRQGRPVYLKDYHREKLLKGEVGDPDDDDDDDEEAPPATYAQEQNALKQAFRAAVAEDSDGADDDGGFIRRKKTEQEPVLQNGVHPSRAAVVRITELDVANADKDPELFLSNFMASRAWVGEDGSNWKPFESDDDGGDDGGDDDRAEEWEQAYNMRFEDPSKSNEVLMTYSRNMANDKSVRRDGKTGRKRARELERQLREEEKLERTGDKARLRKLKIEEAEKKLEQFRHAAGIRGRDLLDEEWVRFLDEEWDNDKWEDAMRQHFGAEYDAKPEEGSSSDASDDGLAKSKKRKRPQKPTWDHDIDINDIVPDFDGQERPTIELSDVESEESEGDEEGEGKDRPSKKRKAEKDRKKERIAAKKGAKQTRSTIEALVDVHMDLDGHDLLDGAAKSQSRDVATDADADAAPPWSSRAPGFRYRETSPNSFGLSGRDILLAPSDAALNQYAGLKKLATFRDPEKKMRERKKMSKKSRLRLWRKEVFGQAFERSGPTFGFEDVSKDGEEDDVDDVNGWRKVAGGREGQNRAIADRRGQDDEGIRKRGKKRKRGAARVEA